MACPKFTHMSKLGSFLSSQVFYWHFTYVNSSVKMSLRFLLRFLSSVADTLSTKIIQCVFNHFRYFAIALKLKLWLLLPLKRYQSFTLLTSFAELSERPSTMVFSADAIINNHCDEMFVFFRKKNLKTWDRVPVWRLMINFVRR